MESPDKIWLVDFNEDVGTGHINDSDTCNPDHAVEYNKSQEKSEAVVTLNDLLYSHEDMVRLCDEAKRDQRHACAEELTRCNRYKDFSNYLRFDEAHQAIMNAAV